MNRLDGKVALISCAARGIGAETAQLMVEAGARIIIQPCQCHFGRAPIGVSDPMHVLICGGGVIGASIAYFLSCRGVKATVIEGTGLACASSGKSGGFLALDWSDGSPLAPLARRSFALHAELAGWKGERQQIIVGHGGPGAL